MSCLLYVYAEGPLRLQRPTNRSRLNVLCHFELLRQNAYILFAEATLIFPGANEYFLHLNTNNIALFQSSKCDFNESQKLGHIF